MAQRAELARSRPVNYEQAVEPFLKTGHLSDSERAMLMVAPCTKAYVLVAQEKLPM